MKKEYLQPFLQASEDISNRFFNMPINRTAYILDKTLELNQDIIVALGIKGELTGIALFGFKKIEALRLVNHVLEQQGINPCDSWDDMAKSVLMEFGNQVTGNVTKLYEIGGFKTDIGTPKFMNAKILENYKEESIRFEIQNACGTITVKLHIKKK